MEALLLFIGVVGNVISVLVFASPIKTFWKIVRNGSTEDFESAPYVVTLLSSSLWVYYGITKPDGFLVATVNGVGIILEAIYVTLFLIYATPSLRAKTAILVALLDVGIFGVVVLVTRLVAIDETTRVMVIGAICACLNVFMYGSPLVAMVASHKTHRPVNCMLIYSGRVDTCVKAALHQLAIYGPDLTNLLLLNLWFLSNAILP